MSELISRQKLIEELSNRFLVSDELTWNEAMYFVIDAIKSQPPADNWIPCDIAVPANTDPSFYDVIVIKRANGETVEGCCWSDRPIWWGGKDGKYFEIIDAVAWKPTVPYKGVE